MAKDSTGASIAIRPDAVIVHLGSPQGTQYSEPAEVGTPNS